MIAKPCSMPSCIILLPSILSPCGNCLIQLRCQFEQMVLITDPALAMHVLYSQHFDKFRFAYSFLDPVSLSFKTLVSGSVSCFAISYCCYLGLIRSPQKAQIEKRSFRCRCSLCLQLLNGSSILTGPTDEHWKQVRKGVAPAFSTQHMK